MIDDEELAVLHQSVHLLLEALPPQNTSRQAADGTKFYRVTVINCKRSCEEQKKKTTRTIECLPLEGFHHR